MEKVLVTGGTGFIGSHTVISLVEKGYEPILIDNFSNSIPQILGRIKSITGKDIRFFEGDCTDFSFLKNVVNQVNGVESIIHFAAFKAVGESVEEPLKYFQNNLGSTINILYLAKELKIAKLVFSSSCTVYGEPDTLPVTEETPEKPANSPYGYTKQVCERMIKDFCHANPWFKAVLLRYFNPVGAHPSGLLGELPQGVPNNLFPYIMQTAAGVRAQLSIYGSDYPTQDGTCIRDYIHVSDLADTHVLSLDYLVSTQNKNLEIFNVGVGKGASVLEVINAFEASTGVKVKYSFAPRRAGDVVQIFADNQKIVTAFGWQPKFTLADSCLHAWQWQKQLNKFFKD
ncbi:MAG: UDP-glucose 4-epimerase GalE [Luteibaculaceae bacterium]